MERHLKPECINSFLFHLDKVEKPVWYKKDLPESTHFGKIEFVPKDVGDLKLKDGKKLI